MEIDAGVDDCLILGQQELVAEIICCLINPYSLLCSKSVTAMPSLPHSSVQFSSVAQSCPTVCDPMNCNMPGLPVHHQLLESTQTHTHRVGGCHPTILSSVVPFSSCPQSFPTSGSFPVSQLFASGGQSIGVSASTSVLPMNTRD